MKILGPSKNQIGETRHKYGTRMPVLSASENYSLNFPMQMSQYSDSHSVEVD